MKIFFKILTLENKLISVTSTTGNICGLYDFLYDSLNSTQAPNFNESIITMTFLGTSLK